MLRRQHREGAISIALLLTMVFLIFPGQVSLHALPPSFFIGTYGEYAPISGEADMGLYGHYSMRSLFEGGGYLSASATASLSGLLAGEDLYDSQRLQAELNLPAGSNRLELRTSFESSLTGVGESGSYLQPSWRAGYRLNRGRRAFNPYIFYTGYYYQESEGSESRIHNGALAGVTYSPRIEIAYDFSLEAGVLQWTDSTRKDLIAGPTAEITGLIGYFSSWEAHLDLLYRNSSFDAESSVSGELSGEIGWSPRSDLTLTIAPAFEMEYLLQESQLITFSQIAARLDYVAGQQVYLYVEPTLSFSDDGTAGVMLSAGVDVSL